LRIIQCRLTASFLGRGNTGGGAVTYVPDAKVPMTGDLLVAPTPFAIGPFIDEWIVGMKHSPASTQPPSFPDTGPSSTTSSTCSW
jgi:hypothetical protein